MESKKYSPMIQHYLETKSKNPDALLFYRLGDFYEMFFEDARIASQELDLVLTAKAAGGNEKVPMCGIPYHAVNGYLQRLTKKGYKIAICEQLSDPKASKGLVERDVIKIVTPGTFMEEGLDACSYNYMAAVALNAWQCAVIYCELSCGELKSVELERNPVALLKSLLEFQVKEVVVTEKFDKKWLAVLEEAGLLVSYAQPVHLDADQQALVQDCKPLVVDAMAILMAYLKETQKQKIDHLLPVTSTDHMDVLVMDYETKQHLELTTTQSSAMKAMSLFDLINQTRSAIGSRMLKTWVENPLASLPAILKRQQAVSSLVKDFLLLESLQEHLAYIYDLERLISRIAYGNATGKDVLQLITSLEHAQILVPMLAGIPGYPEFASTPACTPLYESIAGAIVDNPPATLKEGGLFAKGYCEELDRLREIADHGQNYILELEARERERTGIKALKIGYNRVFGYYIEVRNGSLSQILPEYGYSIRQNLANATRFVTDELKSRESEILTAQENKVRLEQELFTKLLQRIKEEITDLHTLARDLATVDCLCSLASCAADKGWIAPSFNEENRVEVHEGRHPVLDEKLDHFVSNDWIMTPEQSMQLITGPNMGGKSTFMRQNALLVILAQMGSWIPAASASLPVFDRIFTRIGASDDLLKGQSTFMVEMLEANQALKFATSRSLILFDEIGRGTATYDGMALAQAIAEYIDEAIHAKTLFSTHYHELTALEDMRPSIANMHVDVKEKKKQIEFRYRLVSGKANKSYGIHVARLAALPQAVIDRADQLLTSYENQNSGVDYQPNLFVMETAAPEKSRLLERLENLDVDALSPRQALQCLYDLKALYDEIESR